MSVLIDVAYLLVLVIAGPFLWIARRRRGRKLAPLAARMGRRLGERPAAAAPGAPTAPVIWLHAVSVGETLALRALIADVARARPDVRIVLTVTTPAGLEVARRTYQPSAVEVIESPIDFSWVVARFFRALQPSMLVLTELELWPNLLRAARARGVPVVVVNARVSPKSQRRYRRLARVWPGFLRPLTRLCAQDALHQRRLVDVGIDPARIVVTGNLKFDNATLQDAPPARAAFRLRLGWPEAVPACVAGSTHPAEHEMVVVAFATALSAFPTARLLLAPRHAAGVAAAEAALTAAGVSHGRLSVPAGLAGVSCVVLDTMGDLAGAYAAADFAFVGGTLVPVGGHNLLEPAVFAIPMVIGPHHASVRDLADAFAEVGALTVVDGAEALGAAMLTAFAAPGEARGRGAAARDVIRRHRGAAARCASVLASLLPVSRP